MGPNQRQSYRAAIEFPVVYVVEGRPGARAARVNDLSVGGVRMVGDEDVARSTIIDVRFTLPSAAVGRAQAPFVPLSVSGAVVVAFYNLRLQRFVHGVRFVDVPPRTQDEIQRFIHLYQLQALRERADR